MINDAHSLYERLIQNLLSKKTAEKFNYSYINNSIYSGPKSIDTLMPTSELAIISYFNSLGFPEIYAEKSKNIRWDLNLYFKNILINGKITTFKIRIELKGLTDARFNTLMSKGFLFSKHFKTGFDGNRIKHQGVNLDFSISYNDIDSSDLVMLVREKEIKDHLIFYPTHIIPTYMICEIAKKRGSNFDETDCVPSPKLIISKDSLDPYSIENYKEYMKRRELITF